MILDDEQPVPFTTTVSPDPVVNAAEVRGSAVSGIKALGLRTAMTLSIRVGSSMVMARLLLPKDYGIFGIAAWITALGVYLGDAGLAGALVRQHQTPSKDEAFTVFIAQQVLAIIVVVGLVVAGPWLALAANLPVNSVPLLRVMALCMFDNSLRCIPVMTLERELKFGVLARCELIQSLVVTAVTLLVAWRGGGAWSLVIGALVGGAVFTTSTWMVSPWRPVGTFRLNVVKRLARFGMAFQLNMLVPIFLSGWMPVIVGRFAGVAAVGFANWATNIASVPMILSGVLNRVAFPAYARLQSDPQALSRYLVASVRRLSAVMCLVAPVAVIVCPVVIPVLFKDRWIPAIPLVQWFTLDAVLGTLLGITSASQNATGNPGDRLTTAVVAGIGRWVIGYFAIRWAGLAGVGPTLFGWSVLELFWSAVQITRRHPGTAGLAGKLFAPLAATGAILAVSLFAGRLVSEHRLVVSAAISLAVFTSLMAAREMLTGGRTIVHELGAIVRMLRPARPRHHPIET